MIRFKSVCLVAVLLCAGPLFAQDVAPPIINPQQDVAPPIVNPPQDVAPPIAAPRAPVAPPMPGSRQAAQAIYHEWLKTAHYVVTFYGPRSTHVWSVAAYGAHPVFPDRKTVDASFTVKDRAGGRRSITIHGNVVAELYFPPEVVGPLEGRRRGR